MLAYTKKRFNLDLLPELSGKSGLSGPAPVKRLAEIGYKKKGVMGYSFKINPFLNSLPTVSTRSDKTPDPVHRIIFSVEPAKRLIIPRSFKI
jgi:hypothetical protein